GAARCATDRRSARTHGGNRALAGITAANATEPGPHSGGRASSSRLNLAAAGSSPRAAAGSAPPAVGDSSCCSPRDESGTTRNSAMAPHRLIAHMTARYHVTPADDSVASSSAVAIIGARPPPRMAPLCRISDDPEYRTLTGKVSAIMLP